MILSEEIKRLRRRCFLTQEDFANKLGVAFSTVNRWEQSKPCCDEEYKNLLR